MLEDFDPQSLHQTIEVDSQIIRPKLEVELESDVASFVISGSTIHFRSEVISYMLG